MNPTDSVSQPSVCAPGKLQTSPVAEAPRALGGQAGNASFQRLLERLEALGRDPAARPPEAGDALPDALRRADDDFAQAMDLRRRLEEAFAQRR